MQDIAILGGSGFVGSMLANRLAAAGRPVRILTRDREAARDLWLLPDTRCVAVDPYDEAALGKALAGCSALVNLVGILNERGDRGSGFARAHVALTGTALEACANAGVRRYLHMSALNAAPDAPSHYLRSKGEAERRVQAAGMVAWTIFRPSVIFGPGDGLFCRFEALLRHVPVLPLACANARFQPVYVGDVADAFVRALDDRATHGARFDLGGPEIWTLRRIVDYVIELTGRRRLVLPLGPTLSRLQAEVLEHVPGKPFSRDNLRSARLDSVCPGPNGLLALGVTPTPIAAVVPEYIGAHTERRRYDGFRGRARR